jgi:hypothetical protein
MRGLPSAGAQHSITARTSISRGHTDWRLPNVRELQSIVDYGRSNPSIDPVFGATTFFYWSSTSLDDGPGVAWIVRFGVGFVLPGSDIVLEGNGAQVRAVR